MAIDENTFKQFSPFIDNLYEPKKQNRFALYLEDVPQINPSGVGNTLSAADSTVNNQLLISLFKANRPEYSVEKVAVKRFNMTYNTAGAVKFSTELNCEFYDYIDGVTAESLASVAETSKSAAVILYRWFNAIFNVKTGTMGFKKNYTTTGNLYLLDPLGAPIEHWRLKNLFPMDISYADVKYGTTENLKITVKFKYDKPFLVSSTDTSPATAIDGTYQSNVIIQ